MRVREHGERSERDLQVNLDRNIQGAVGVGFERQRMCTDVSAVQLDVEAQRSVRRVCGGRGDGNQQCCEPREQRGMDSPMFRHVETGTQRAAARITETAF